MCRILAVAHGIGGGRRRNLEQRKNAHQKPRPRKRGERRSRDLKGESRDYFDLNAFAAVGKGRRGPGNRGGADEAVLCQKKGARAANYKTKNRIVYFPIEVSK